jgi:hypothetical protein
MMRVIGIGKAALNRALKRGEIAQCPHILTVSVGKTPPMATRGTCRSCSACIGTRSRMCGPSSCGRSVRGQGPRLSWNCTRQIEFEFGLIHVNPPEREQVPRKYRPTVRLPDALWEEFEGRGLGRPTGEKHQERAVAGPATGAASRAARPTHFDTLRPAGCGAAEFRRSTSRHGVQVNGRTAAGFPAGTPGSSLQLCGGF